MNLEPVDILAIGAHPDDVEYAIGGTLLLHRRQGYRVGLLDLTRGELGSKGNPEQRQKEAEAAAHLLGASFRANLGLPDGGVVDTPEAAQALARVLRACRPLLVLTHWGEDRHPDHRGAYALTRRALFLAALRHLDLGLPHHLVRGVLFYPSNEWVEPDLVVEVSEVWAEREEAMRCYRSQFLDPTLEVDHVYFGVRDYLEMARLRARHYGQRVGGGYGEAFLAPGPLRLRDLPALFR